MISPGSETPALFVAYSAPDFGVFESQVFEYGNFAHSLNLSFRYLLFEGLRTAWSSYAAIGRRLSSLQQRYSASIDVRYLPSPMSTTGLWLAGAFIRGHAMALNSPVVVIQARGAAATCAALEAKRRLPAARIVFDARGDEAAEYRLQASLSSTDSTRRWWLKRAVRAEALERRACAEADEILAVSHPLRERLQALGAIPSERITVVPCCVNPERLRHEPTERLALRRSFGIEGKQVLVYSGSLGSYQIPDRIAALVSAIRERLPQTHLLLMTRDASLAARHFSALRNAGAVSIVDAAFEDVGRYLAIADAALLLRLDDPVNLVACPVKFAEYVVSGLPVIVTPHIGDVSAYVRDTGDGVVVDLDRSVQDQAARVVEALTSGRWPDRSKVRARARGVFSREAYRPRYEELVRRLGVRS